MYCASLCILKTNRVLVGVSFVADVFRIKGTV